LARAGFIFYLILIHLWSFVILFFHAHSFEEHGDFGAGVGVPHGPHAMMTQKRVISAVEMINADAFAAVPELDEPNSKPDIPGHPKAKDPASKGVDTSDESEIDHKEESGA
jgi:hypothetical protein